MRARLNSSFTYADRAGNIFYLWNAAIPSLPHPSGGDTVAVPVTRRRRHRGRTTCRSTRCRRCSTPRAATSTTRTIRRTTRTCIQPLDPAKYPAYFPEPQARPAQPARASTLIDTTEQAVARRTSSRSSTRIGCCSPIACATISSPRCARRIRPATSPRRSTCIAKWDKTVAPTSRGGVLFETWWRRYIAGTRADTMYAEPWIADAPGDDAARTSSPARAPSRRSPGRSTETTRRYGALDVAWGDVHRVRRGNVDVPVGGCSGDIGCFRVLNYRDDPDGKRQAIGGDGWVLAVEFGDEPRAYLGARVRREPATRVAVLQRSGGDVRARRTKPVAWSEADIAKQTVVRYRPGEKK